MKGFSLKHIALKAAFLLLLVVVVVVVAVVVVFFLCFFFIGAENILCAGASVHFSAPKTLQAGAVKGLRWAAGVRKVMTYLTVKPELRWAAMRVCWRRDDAFNGEAIIYSMCWRNDDPCNSEA